MNRPASLAQCAPRIDDLRAVAQRFLNELPGLAVRDALRADLALGLNDLLARLPLFQDAALHGNDQQALDAARSIGNAIDEIRQAGR